MIGLQTHRLARTRYSGSLALHLADGETIAHPQITAERLEAGGWTDRTAELIESGAATVGPDGVQVEFWKRVALEGEQPRGAWRVVVTATSSDGEVVVGTVPVEVVG